MNENEENRLMRVVAVQQRLRNGTEGLMLLDDYQKLRAAKRQEREKAKVLSAPPKLKR